MTPDEELTYLRRRYAETLHELGYIKAKLGLHSDATLNQVMERIAGKPATPIPDRPPQPAWDDAL